MERAKCPRCLEPWSDFAAKSWSGASAERMNTPAGLDRLHLSHPPQPYHPTWELRCYGATPSSYSGWQVPSSFWLHWWLYRHTTCWWLQLLRHGLHFQGPRKFWQCSRKKCNTRTSTGVITATYFVLPLPSLFAAFRCSLPVFGTCCRTLTSAPSACSPPSVYRKQRLWECGSFGNPSVVPSLSESTFSFVGSCHLMAHASRRPSQEAWTNFCPRAGSGLVTVSPVRPNPKCSGSV